MAIAACVRCQNQSFELQEAKISGARHRVMFVQCAACGAPAGLIDGHAAALLEEQNTRIEEMQRQIAAIESSVTHIRQWCQRLGQPEGAVTRRPDLAASLLGICVAPVLRSRKYSIICLMRIWLTQ